MLFRLAELYHEEFLYVRDAFASKLEICVSRSRYNGVSVTAVDGRPDIRHADPAIGCVRRTSIGKGEIGGGARCSFKPALRGKKGRARSSWGRRRGRR